MDKPAEGGKPAEAGADPSMEDILASIRRILSEDEPPPPEEMPTPKPNAGPGILVLDQSMLVAEESQLEQEPIPPKHATPPASAAPPPDAAPRAPETPPQPPPSSAPAAPQPSQRLVAPEAAAAAAQSVGALVRQLGAERGTQVSRGGPTIEDLVREEVRPLLKEWLDAHLPPLVERLVRAEIERVVARAAD